MANFRKSGLVPLFLLVNLFSVFSVFQKENHNIPKCRKELKNKIKKEHGDY
jgi:hypothetical protein